MSIPVQLIDRISISFAKIFEYINHARPNLTYIKSILYLIEIPCKHNLQCITESLRNTSMGNAGVHVSTS